MANLNTGSQIQEKLVKWYEAKEKLNLYKALEAKLRMEIFGEAFPDPHEGTNKHDLPEGFVLKATYPYNRKVDVAALTALTPKLRDANVVIDDVIKSVPELIKSGYNKLSEEQTKLFDECLIIKPGMPSLEIVKPKRGN